MIEFSIEEIEKIKEALQQALLFVQEHPADDAPTRKIRDALEIVIRKVNSQPCSTPTGDHVK